MRQADWVTETADQVFGQKAMIGLAEFGRKTGIQRQTALRMAEDGELEVVGVKIRVNRKLMVPRPAFERMLRRNGVRREVR